MVSDYGTFSVARGSCRIACRPGQQVSLIAVDKNTRVNSRNLKYPLNDLALDMWWQGTLNEALQDHFDLDISPGCRLLIYLQS